MPAGRMNCMVPVVSVSTGVVIDIFSCLEFLPNRKPARSLKASEPLAVGSVWAPPLPREDSCPKAASATKNGSYLHSQSRFLTGPTGLSAQLGGWHASSQA